MSRSTAHKLGILLCSASLLFISLVLTLFLLPPHGQDLSAKLATQDFGIGFDLTTSYGTVAVAYPNGSVISIAKIEGDAAYKEMMFRLSLDSSKTTHKPYLDMGDQWTDYPRQIWRTSRKRLGLPASNDVGTLSRMITALRVEASVFVGKPIAAAIISISVLAALYGEDTVDAFEYISLANLEFYTFKKYFAIYTFNSVYLRRGKELVSCTEDSDEEICPGPGPGQQLRESEFRAMTVSYTNSSLTAGSSWFSTCYSGFKYGSATRGVANMHLGYDERHSGEYGEGPYWEKVKYVLSNAMLHEADSITKIIVSGNAAAEPQFMKVLTEAAKEVVHCKMPEYIDGDPVWSAAKGSAEFAKRALDATREQGIISEGQEEL